MSTTTQPTVFSCQWKIIRILTHLLLDLRFFHIWRSLYNLFVLLILSASFTLASVILQVQHFYILSLPRCSDGFYNVLSDEDGWWIRTTFIRFATSKVHLFDNFTYNHSVPTRTRTCHAQQNSFCCCHPPEYKRTHDFAHDQLRNVLSALFTNLYYRVLWKSVRSSISHGAYPTWTGDLMLMRHMH